MFTSVLGGGIIESEADAQNDPAVEITAPPTGNGARSVRSDCGWQPPSDSRSRESDA
jgi:hypothetical protein